MIRKVLILGNSLVRHEPLAEVGWAHDFGMAASCEEKDFVHVLERLIRGRFPQAEVMSFNIADFERQFPTEEFAPARFATELARQWRPDWIVMKIGENADDEHSVENDFEGYYQELIRRLRTPGQAQVLCGTCFWDKKHINDLIARVARRNGYGLVDIMSLGLDSANQALGQFEHPGVCAHPNDRGMERIARAFWAKMEEQL